MLSREEIIEVYDKLSSITRKIETSFSRGFTETGSLVTEEKIVAELKDTVELLSPFVTGNGKRKGKREATAEFLRDVAEQLPTEKNSIYGGTQKAIKKLNKAGQKALNPNPKGAVFSKDEMNDMLKDVRNNLNEQLNPYSKGTKHDKGKLRFDLIPVEVEEALCNVLTFGAKKYSPNNWKDVEPFEDRYFAAKRRHENARRNGTIFDDETGLPHRAHELTCLAFLLWKDIQKFGGHRERHIGGK